jgi:hypothetical protein
VPQLAIVCKIIFFTTVGIIKISICLFLRRISEATTKYSRTANDIFLFLLVAYTLLALFWSCFQCSPAPAMWDKIYSGKLAQPAKCWSTLVVANTLSVIHVVMDFVLLLTPIVVLWSVRLNKNTKIRLFIVFSMGSLSCVASILRELAQKSISKDITCKSIVTSLSLYLLTLFRWLYQPFGMDCSRLDTRSSCSIASCHQCTHPKGMG